MRGGIYQKNIAMNVMDKAMCKNTASSCLEKVAQFCTVYSELCNVHTVDFITKNYWNVLPVELQDELFQLSEEELQSLPNADTLKFLQKRNFPHLAQVISDAQKHTLENLNICSFLSQLLLPSYSNVDFKGIPSNWGMTLKKYHEVKSMANIVAALSVKHDIKTIVDVGSGKGYLSTFLALHHSLDVLGIDGSSGNTRGANNRNTKIGSLWLKQLKALTKGNNNEMCNAEKFSKCQTNVFLSDAKAQLHDTSVELKTVNICPESSANQPPTIKYSPGIFISRTHQIKRDTDFHSLIRDFLITQSTERNKLRNCECFDGQNSGANAKDKVLLCALHACGNLSASLMKHFTSTYLAKVLCCVGCCYHHLEEQFFRNPFQNYGDPEPEEYGFPLSSRLLECKYALGRNARMLASQSVDRIANNRTLPNKAMFYRAVLQVILTDHCNQESQEFHIGKLAVKCSGFTDYVYKALSKLKLHYIKLTESEINHYLIKYAEEEKKLFALQQLRIILAPCIETLVLLDRLVFLLEQDNVEEAYVVRLFDPVKSPRCFGLIAMKS